MPSPAALFASLVFGAIGITAFFYGKKHALVVPMVLGAGLMIFPYFVSDVWLMWAIGAAMVAAMWFFRE
jgi:hypothetical protein